MKHFGIILILFFMSPIALAAEFELSDTDAQKQMQISALRNEISELELQLSECKRQNKNWRAATWVGAAGTAVTGTAAIVQGVKLNKLKKEKSNPSTESKNEK